MDAISKGVVIVMYAHNLNQKMIIFILRSIFHAESYKQPSSILNVLYLAAAKCDDFV